MGAALGVEVLIGEIVGVEDLLRCEFAMDTDTLKDFYFRAKERIFQITSAVPGTIFGVRDGAIDV
jgi:hypothetical protein